jgi:8-oxo-dGTP pyrophosphatase MutT (NUDIX family)
MTLAVWAQLGRFLALLLSPLIRRTIEGSQRARVLVVNTEDNTIVLVQSWLGNQKWELPGGGIKKGESALAAARRELREETGIDEKALRSCLRLGSINHRGYQATLFHAIISPAPLKAQFPEVLRVGYFDLEDLPLKRSKLVDEALSMLAE